LYFSVLMHGLLQLISRSRIADCEEPPRLGQRTDRWFDRGLIRCLIFWLCLSSFPMETRFRFGVKCQKDVRNWNRSYISLILILPRSDLSSDYLRTMLSSGCLFGHEFNRCEMALFKIFGRNLGNGQFPSGRVWIRVHNYRLFTMGVRNRNFNAIKYFATGRKTQLSGEDPFYF